MLVDGDLSNGRQLRARLIRDAYEVDWVQDRQAAERSIDAVPYALVLLELGPQNKDGFAVLAELRRRAVRVPVLAIVARDALPECVIGIDLGAENCVVVPEDLKALASEICHLLRRCGGTESLAGSVLQNGVVRQLPLISVAAR